MGQFVVLIKAQLFYNLGIGRGTSVLAIELSRPPPCKKGPIYFTQMRLLIVHQISCVPL
ncbi:hypothetical protein Hanom_Chr12g01115231 [Helianthus anomalus]